MKKVFIALFGAIGLMTAACSDNNDAPVVEESIQVLPSESLGIEDVAKEMSVKIYDAEAMPAGDCSYVEYDTIVDKATGNFAKTVGAMTLYVDHVVGDVDSYFSLPASMQNFKNLRSLKLYFTGGSHVDLNAIPKSVNSVTVSRVPGTEDSRIILKDKVWDKRGECTITELTIHGTDLQHVRIYGYRGMVYDVSDNMIEDAFDSTNPFYLDSKERVVMSNNKITIPEDLWNIFMHWTEKEYEHFPDLRNNNIEIPDRVVRTSWYATHQEWFVGNPGYVKR